MASITAKATRLSPADALTEIRASAPGPTVGAFFDLDGTLVDGFTAAVHVGDRIRRRQAGIGELLGVFEAALRYRFGRLEFEHLILRAAGYLRGEALEDLEELGERLFTERVASRLYVRMHQVVQAHQERGHTVVLSSSALSMQALPVARFLGIVNVQCNHFEVDDSGRLTGGIVRPIVWGATKADAVQRFCADNGIALQSSYFYADGDEDAASMSLVGYPRPVNPRAGLAAAAAAHGWPVMCLASGRRGPVRRLRHLTRQRNRS
ncbi:HAD-IB family hydrolase [Mycobacterium parmense]|uniref:Haloacid dehalogenase n=1 Tax=Mycobacterium parmense TaxID=185642 RepID=A0A7I7YQJ7_9MYCO|nr:HAD-IB family hydrolase [Mycobacterium parmense]MCV7353409.1 HAD-IB family hydrolase [Mycobacterium parmense]ORW51564.1 haloacid dehalogenase [Mycobacterium parmense]BBZ44030.1 haloacid dehalogenase [Mycobacterium parmense]